MGDAEHTAYVVADDKSGEVFVMNALWERPADVNPRLYLYTTKEEAREHIDWAYAYEKMGGAPAAMAKAFLEHEPVVKEVKVVVKGL